MLAVGFLQGMSCFHWGDHAIFGAALVDDFREFECSITPGVSAFLEFPRIRGLFVGPVPLVHGDLSDLISDYPMVMRE